MINDEYICRKQYCSGLWDMEDVLKNHHHSIMTQALKNIWCVMGEL